MPDKADDVPVQEKHPQAGAVVFMHGTLLLAQVAVYSMALLPCLPLTVWLVARMGIWIGLPVGIAASFHLASLGVIFGAALLCRIAAGKLTPGTYSMESKEARRWLRNMAFCEIARRTPFFPYVHHYTPLAWLFYRMLGARIAFHVNLGHAARITDPWLVRIESGSTLGDSAHVVSHFIQRGQLVLSEVVIGQGATVGGNSVLSPGCRIGAHATLANYSMLTKGRAIPEGETWAGIPARKLNS